MSDSKFSPGNASDLATLEARIAERRARARAERDAANAKRASEVAFLASVKTGERRSPTEARNRDEPFIDDETDEVLEDVPKKEGGRADIPVPPARKSRSWRGLALSALIIIGLPTLLGALYFGFIASDQYVSEARFGLRTGYESDVSGAAFGGHTTGSMSAAALVADSFAIVDYVNSREIVADLDKQLDLRAMWATPQADFIARLNADDTSEGLWRQWKRMVKIDFDISTGAIILAVRAFTADDSLRLAEAILRSSEALVNRMSDKARRDSVAFSNIEVQRAETRLIDARLALQNFRMESGVLDPQKEAEANLMLAAKLRGDIAATAAQIESLSSGGLQRGPTLERLQAQLNSLRQQLTALNNARISRSATAESGANGNDQKLSSLMGQYEKLETQRHFAEMNYTSALQSREAARVVAERQLLYTVVAANPQLAQESLYPRRLLFTFLTLLTATLAWVIGMLLFYAVRDHA